MDEMRGPGSFWGVVMSAIAAAVAHSRHEAQTGKPDPKWPDWDAEYMVREQSGAALE
jgi:hypothetical protein